MLDVIRANAQSWGVKLAFGLIIIVFVFWGVGGLTGGPSTVVLTVNDKPITAQDFQRQFAQIEQNLRAQNPNLTPEELKNMQLKRRVVQQMVLETMLTQEAERVGLSVTPVELRQRIESFPIFFGENGKFDPKVYVKMLEGQRNTPGRFETQLSSELLMEKLQQEVTAGAYVSEAEARDLFMHDGEKRVLEYVLFPFADYTKDAKLDDGAAKAYFDANTVAFRVPAKADTELLRISAETIAPAFPVEDAEAKAYYDKNTSRFVKTERIKARHIIALVPENAPDADVKKAKERIEGLAKRVRAGEDFAALAREFSEDGAAAEGGDLGWFERDRMVKSFGDAAFALKPGQVSEPVRTEFGYHLIKVEGHEPSGLVPYEEISGDLKKLLATEKASGKLQDALDEILTSVINGKSLNDAGAPYKLTAEPTGLLDAENLVVATGLKNADVQKIFLAEPGKIIDSPFTSPQGYVLVKLNSLTPETVKPFDSVQEVITGQLLAEKAQQLAMDAATAARAAFPAPGAVASSATPSANATAPVNASVATPAAAVELPAQWKSKAQKSQPMGRDGMIPGLGTHPELAEIAFNAPVNQWLPVAFALNNGVALARVVELVAPTEENWNNVSKPLVDALSNAKREQLYRSFVALLEAQTKVQIHDETLFVD